MRLVLLVCHCLFSKLVIIRRLLIGEFLLGKRMEMGSHKGFIVFSLMVNVGLLGCVMLLLNTDGLFFVVAHGIVMAFQISDIIF